MYCHILGRRRSLSVDLYGERKRIRYISGPPAGHLVNGYRMHVGIVRYCRRIGGDLECLSRGGSVVPVRSSVIGNRDVEMLIVGRAGWKSLVYHGHVREDYLLGGSNPITGQKSSLMFAVHGKGARGIEVVLHLKEVMVQGAVDIVIAVRHLHEDVRQVLIRVTPVEVQQEVDKGGIAIQVVPVRIVRIQTDEITGVRPRHF